MKQVIVGDQILYRNWSAKTLLDAFPEREYLASGLMRRAYRIAPGFVVKVEKAGSQGANRKEVETWERLLPEDRNFFVPMLTWHVNHEWVCMSEAFDIAAVPDDDWKDRLFAAGRDNKVFDLHADNLGWHWVDGERHPCIIDYGEYGDW